MWVFVGRPATHWVQADWQCTRLQFNSSCLRVHACAHPTGDSVWAYWRTNCADIACQIRSACLHPAFTTQRTSSLLPPSSSAVWFPQNTIFMWKLLEFKLKEEGEDPSVDSTHSSNCISVYYEIAQIVLVINVPNRKQDNLEKKNVSKKSWRRWFLKLTLTLYF